MPLKIHILKNLSRPTLAFSWPRVNTKLRLFPIYVLEVAPLQLGMVFGMAKANRIEREQVREKRKGKEREERWESVISWRNGALSTLKNMIFYFKDFIFKILISLLYYRHRRNGRIHKLFIYVLFD